MASEFLKRKAEEQAKKIDKEYGKGTYGSTTDLEKKNQKTTKTTTKTSEKSSHTKSEGAEAEKLEGKASDFLKRKVVESSLVNARQPYKASNHNIIPNATPVKLIYEETPRSANFWDLTVNSIARGYINSKYGIESYKDMYGYSNTKDEYEKSLQSDKYNYAPDNKFEEFLAGAMELLGQQGAQWTDADSLGMATGAAGAVAAAGQLGPQVALPEEAVTVPVAFIAGLTAGSAKTNYEIEAGLAYNEMIEKGIDPDTAKKVATGVGAVNAALEMAQMDDLAKSTKIASKTKTGNIISDNIMSYILKRGGHIATETGQEVLQEASTLAGIDLARGIDGKDAIYGWGEVGERLGDTALSSAGSFALLGAGGDVANLTTNKLVSNVANSKNQEKKTTNGGKISVAVCGSGGALCMW